MWVLCIYYQYGWMVLSVITFGYTSSQVHLNPIQSIICRKFETNFVLIPNNAKVALKM